MQHFIRGAGLLALTATAASAGGVDRSGQSVAVIFEQGNYAEFSLGTVSPDVSGTAVAIPAPGLNSAQSGDMAASYLQFGGAYKHSFGNGLDAAIIFDQPFGADVDYPTGTNYYAQGATAELNSSAITAVLKYRFASNVSVYGGLRYQTLQAEAVVPFVANYTGTSTTDSALGYLVGVAYEKPEIALRVALTYNSKISHDLDTTETIGGGAAVNSITEVDTPQSFNLEFQSGIAKNTLLFGSIRWAEWSEFDITPAVYFGATGASLVSYENDTISYSLGLGRKFSDTWSGAVTIGYEKQDGGFASNLGPTDGYWSVGLGGTYTRGNVKITGGVRYVGIGDAQTRLPAAAPSANFDDNTGFGAGIKVGITF